MPTLSPGEINLFLSVYRCVVFFFFASPFTFCFFFSFLTSIVISIVLNQRVCPTYVCINFFVLQMGAGRVVANATSTTDVIIFTKMPSVCTGYTYTCMYHLLSFRFSTPTPPPIPHVFCNGLDEFKWKYISHEFCCPTCVSMKYERVVLAATLGVER